MIIAIMRPLYVECGSLFGARHLPDGHTRSIASADAPDLCDVAVNTPRTIDVDASEASLPQSCGHSSRVGLSESSRNLRARYLASFALSVARSVPHSVDDSGDGTPASSSDNRIASGIKQSRIARSSVIGKPPSGC
jgi:hypothetical protein